MQANIFLGLQANMKCVENCIFFSLLKQSLIALIMFCTLRTDTLHTQGSSTPVPALALILHMNENLFFQRTQLAWTGSLWDKDIWKHLLIQKLKQKEQLFLTSLLHIWRCV